MSKMFLEVLNISIMTGWAVLAVLLLRLLLIKAPAWVRCALWGIVGLRLVWPFHISSPVSLIPSRHTLPYGQLYDYTPELNTGLDVLDEIINPGFTQVYGSEITNSVNPLQVWLELAGWVWLVGIAAMFFYGVVSYLRLRRRVAVSMPLEGKVFLCDQVDSPFILGLFCPKIYLPSGCNEAQKVHILAHEYCHLARKDHWWKPLGFVLLTVHWFNPLLWLAYILLCRDIELACDERVIAQMSQQEKKEYSGTLLECSADAKAVSVCPLAFGEVGVKKRIKAVLHYKKPVLWIVIVAIVACVAVAVCFLTEPGSGISNHILRAEELIYSNPMMSYCPGTGMRFRITEDNVLQYYQEHPNSSWSVGWYDMGRMEPFILTKENFDDRFNQYEGYPVDIYAKAAVIRMGNQNAWIIQEKVGDGVATNYLLQQKDDTWYYFMTCNHLLLLVDTGEIAE